MLRSCGQGDGDDDDVIVCSPLGHHCHGGGEGPANQTCGEAEEESESQHLSTMAPLHHDGHTNTVCPPGGVGVQPPEDVGAGAAAAGGEGAGGGAESSEAGAEEPSKGSSSEPTSVTGCSVGLAHTVSPV